MKIGDMVKLKNLHEEWGEVALVTRIQVTENGLGQVHLLVNGTLRTVPWLKRAHYAEVISENKGEHPLRVEL